jgi:hypothetical protein
LILYDLVAVEPVKWPIKTHWRNFGGLAVGAIIFSLLF